MDKCHHRGTQPTGGCFKSTGSSAGCITWQQAADNGAFGRHLGSIWAAAEDDAVGERWAGVAESDLPVSPPVLQRLETVLPPLPWLHLRSPFPALIQEVRGRAAVVVEAFRVVVRVVVAAVVEDRRWVAVMLQSHPCVLPRASSSHVRPGWCPPPVRVGEWGRKVP